MLADRKPLLIEFQCRLRLSGPFLLCSRSSGFTLHGKLILLRLTRLLLTEEKILFQG
jgi:hypothetical protein